ncbi:hypothetical protein KBD33_04655 [Candidatus Gracilibacteria bacterium]|nr:hypothetical protein [Candidatus Gracilibacteria bacterium]
MKTLIFIHGGMSFTSQEEYLSWLQSDYTSWCTEKWTPGKKKWKTEAARKWTELGGTVYIPEAPNELNAKYNEWKIVFDTVFSLDEEPLILVGHSLGGCFLLKYFSETTEHGLLRTSQGQRKIDQIHLVAACLSEGDFTLPANYESLQQLGNRVHIWHAEDDDIVPFSVGQELSLLLPDAQTHFFSKEKGYGHFSKVEELEELEKVIGL